MGRHDLTDTFTRLRQRLQALATFILRNEEDAEDALQEAFCRMWVRKDLCDKAPMEGHLMVAVRNVCIDYLRRKKNRKTDSIEVHNASELRAAEGVVNDISLWEEAEVKELTAQLMSKLSDTQKSVFEMVSGGMDYDIIAMRLGKSEISVRQHMCRARKILASEYKKWLENG